MSGLLKGIGKVFKKVAKVVKKVLPYALVIGAIVLTGGAAIGALPAVGTMIGGLGLSAGVTSALTSAVTMAGWGGLAGLVTGGKKGMLMGGAMGALSGGLLGAVGGLGGAVAPSAVAGGPGAMPFDLLAQGGGTAAAGAATSGPGIAGGGGLMSTLFGGQGGISGGLLGNVLGGLGGGMGAAGEVKAQKEMMRDKWQHTAENYDLDGSPLGSGLLSPFKIGYSDIPAPQLDPYESPSGWVYDPAQGKVVRKSPGG
jgi:hypothetical protein